MPSPRRSTKSPTLAATSWVTRALERVLDRDDALGGTRRRIAGGRFHGRARIPNARQVPG